MSKADGIDLDAMREFGASVDFGKSASDYASHRAGFPQAFFDLVAARGYASAGQHALDVGTGTGTVARGLARMGLTVTGLDPATPLLQEARALDAQAGVNISYLEGRAEDTGLPDEAFDLVTAGQCWHWVDPAMAGAEMRRLLKPGGRIVIAHFDWLPLPDTVVEASEALILKYNPAWAGAGGTGIYARYLAPLSSAGFTTLETASLDISHPYTHDGWRGRIRASAGISASLSAAEVTRFDAEHAEMLAAEFPQDRLDVPHRVWLVTGIKG